MNDPTLTPYPGRGPSVMPSSGRVHLTPYDARPSRLLAPTPRHSQVASLTNFPPHDSGVTAGPSHRLAPTPLPNLYFDSDDSSDTQQEDWDVQARLPARADINAIHVPDSHQFSGIRIPLHEQGRDSHRDDRYNSPDLGTSSTHHRRNARISPDIIDQPPQRLREPPARGATPLRSALRRPTPPQDPRPRSRRDLPPIDTHHLDQPSPIQRPRLATPWQRPQSISQSPEYHQRPDSHAYGGNTPYPRYSRRPPQVPPVVPDLRDYHHVPSDARDPTHFTTPGNPGRRAPPQITQQPVAPQYSTPLRTHAGVSPSVRYNPYIPRPPASAVTLQSTADDVVDGLMNVPVSRVVWQTARGELAWIPHPMPAPAVLPHSFWAPNLLGAPHNWSQQRSPMSARTAALLTGGNPLPGTVPYWTPGVWPPTSLPPDHLRVPVQVAPLIIPNPCNAYLPHLMWDISQLPTTAKRITGNHVIVGVTSKFKEVATYPPVDRLVIACNVGVAQRVWGAIEVRRSGAGGVSIWDVLNAIHDFFQVRIGRRELDIISQALGDPEMYDKMVDAMFQRCIVTPALPGYEMKNGLKRIDCLGDATFFWGLYVTYNEDQTWQMNLGLVNRKRMA